jgi:phage antirepressor YoqD-like protein
MLVKFENIELNVIENNVHEWLLDTAIVAKGYGVTENAINNHRVRKPDELVEGKHWITQQIVDPLQRVQNKVFWTKRGVVRLGFGMHGEIAKRFRDFAEDLVINPNNRNLPNFQNPIEAARAWADAEEARLRAIEANEEAERVINQLAPKVEQQEKEIKKQAPKVQYYNEVLQSDSTYTTTQIAKELGMGAPTLNRKLQKMGVQYKQSGQWLLYHKHQGKGYTKTHTYTYADSNTGEAKTSLSTVWTEAGRNFIHRLIKEKVY